MLPFIYLLSSRDTFLLSLAWKQCSPLFLQWFAWHLDPAIVQSSEQSPRDPHVVSALQGTKKNLVSGEIEHKVYAITITEPSSCAWCLTLWFRFLCATSLQWRGSSYILEGWERKSQPTCLLTERPGFKPSTIWIWNHRSFSQIPCCLFSRGAPYEGSVICSKIQREQLESFGSRQPYPTAVLPGADTVYYPARCVFLSPLPCVISWAAAISSSLLSLQHLAKFLEHSNYSINVYWIDEPEYIYPREACEGWNSASESSCSLF